MMVLYQSVWLNLKDLWLIRFREVIMTGSLVMTDNDIKNKSIQDV